jgi:glycosyltransferase involved in cell wall biosynthesis
MRNEPPPVQNPLPGMLSLLIPSYNEGACIYENLLSIEEQVCSLAEDYEIIVINDGSLDQTEAEIRRACARHAKIRMISYPQNMGKGYALRQGTESAAGDFIAFCDADLELAPVQLGDFILRMREENADVVIGSKMHRDSKVNYPLIRRIYSYGYYFLLLCLFRLQLLDTQSGMKLFKADVLKPVMRQILVKRFAFDIEILAIINSRGYRIISAPIEVKFKREAFGRLHYYDRPQAAQNDGEEQQA